MRNGGQCDIEHIWVHFRKLDELEKQELHTVEVKERLDRMLVITKVWTKGVKQSYNLYV